MVAESLAVAPKTEDIALAAAEALKAVSGTTVLGPAQPPRPPSPLPPGWILRESISQPGYYYYYNQETSVSTWQTPVVAKYVAVPYPSKPSLKAEPQHPESSTAVPAPEHPPAANAHKRSSTATDTADDRKRVKQQERPKQVRVLHILKKHANSRKPSSWRNPNITATIAEAKEELMGLIELLHEVQSDPAELKATVQELARTESDCSSAKRGGDLGFFGPKKMQPSFEAAAFALEIGELSGVVETSSGVHVLLRIG